MVNDLLELARTQLGDGIPLRRQNCDLLDVCHWAIIDANAVHPGATFVLDARGDVTGCFDGPRLQQLMTNLATNAAQYGAAGTPITIGLHGDPQRVVFTVKNQGSTIAAATVGVLFEPFVQMPQQDGLPARRSLGLGLYIAQHIAEAHGGNITVASDMLSGTVFTVEIPRTRED